MSDIPPTARKPSLALSIIMIAIGLLLLLPGVCSGVFMVAALRSTFRPGGHLEYDLISFWVVGFAITAGGIALIVQAVRRMRS